MKIMKYIKRLISLLFFTTLVFIASGQKEKTFNDVYYNHDKTININQINQNLQNPNIELSWVKLNLGNYQKQRKTAFIFQIAGTAATGASFFIKDQQYKNIASGVGMTLSLTGVFALLSAEKYLILASKPAPK